MTNSSYYTGRRSFMTADLKRTAHAVRCAIDAKPITKDPDSGLMINPRKRRLVSIPVGDSEYKVEAPSLSPRARHTLAWRPR